MRVEGKGYPHLLYITTIHCRCRWASSGRAYSIQILSGGRLPACDKQMYVLLYLWRRALRRCETGRGVGFDMGPARRGRRGVR